VSDKLQDIEEEILQSLSYDHEVDVIIGAKMDKDSLWFYVRWDDNKTAFVPAHILNKIAPDKVISYYEGILSFSSTPGETTPIGKESVRKRVANTIMDRKVGKVVEKQLKEQEKEKEKQKQKQLQQQQQQQNGKSDPKQATANKLTIQCLNCARTLQFPSTAKMIKCPLCSTTMNVQQLQPQPPPQS